MSVLRNIAGKMASRVDDVARLWLPPRIAGEPARDREFAVIRSIAASALVAFPAVPLALCAMLPASLALPVGAGLVTSAALLASVGAVSYLRGQSALMVQAAVPEVSAVAQGACYDFFAGLVTVHDIRGTVTAVHGRDAAAYLTWMRDPAGRGFLDQIHVSDRLLFLTAIDTLRQGNGQAVVEIRFERPSLSAEGDQFVHMRCEMTAIFAGESSDAALSSILVQSFDISDEARLREEAAHKAALAESANDAKSRFLAAVSHELRTPLNAILGFSDILSGEYFGKLENDRQREYVKLINQSGSHLLSVVNTMLDMSKIEAGRYELIPELFPIADAVKACEGMLALQAREKGVQLTSRLMRGIGDVNADERAIHQILINLVGNAIKFTDAGGLVTIDADTTHDTLRLVVSDTGIGIAHNKLALIGQPFVQVQNDYTRKYEGTGLGLSLVKGLVALHGGSFEIASRAGEGTVVTVTIPLDGSGIVTGEQATLDRVAATGTMVEFPPRLKDRVETREILDLDKTHGATSAARSSEGPQHGATKAKTA
ncbi:cell cycle sensor histidine kinase DivJ [Pararhizobium capsulatum DSM 1112]|uniref:histidine kinase n=1 Tax=Pararhizobium capsulatum DSM 1112 TaxID=1121113 RepID=A0ABU0BPI1_9HYPH|nr:HAMP domain-containing sensor histidine kinase [Pararhizobium capsulatum]MDQ0319581.1 cell cycle sensor histidine kinase DivJ [Pararhizobium capsulatum DSM 1112]